MRLHTLQLRNFRQYADARIDFQPGLTAIVGPNGAGKTTLLEAIAWALYGSPAIRGNNESLRRAGAPARSPVEASLEFSLGSHRYRIFRRPDRAELFIDGGASPVHSGLQPVAEAVRKLLGMDYRAFFTSYFTGQKELAFLAGMGKQERATFVSRMLGYDRLSRAREKANQERLALDREIDGLQKGMGDPSEIAGARKHADADLTAAQQSAATAAERHARAEKARDAITPKFERSDARRVRYEAFVTARDLAARSRDHIEVEIGIYRDEIARLDELERELADIQPDIDAYRRAERDFDAMRPLIQYEKERRDLMGRQAVLNEEIAKSQEKAEGLEAARSLLNSVQAQRKTLADAAEQARDDLARAQDEWSARRAELLAERKGGEARLKTLTERRARVGALGEGGECPTCARPLGGDLASVLAHFDGEISEANRTLQTVQTQLLALGREPSRAAALTASIAQYEKESAAIQEQEQRARDRLFAIQSADRSLREHLKSLAAVEDRLATLPEGFDQERFNELADIAKRLKPVYKRGIEIESALQSRPEKVARQQEAEKKWVEASEEVDRLEKEIKRLEFDPDAHTALAAQKAVADAEERAALEAAAEARQERARAEEAVRHAREREEDYRRKAEDLQERQTRRLYLRTLTEAYEALRVELNARARPELEEAAGRFLDALTDGRYTMLELTDQYEPFILDDNERKPVISGGEEDITHLCLRLAISQMIADRSGQPLSLLVLDEIFGSLDATRRDNVVALLQNLKATFDQIILITHIEAVNDVVDRCLWVSFDAETRTSRISESRAEPPEREDDPTGWGDDLSEAA